MDDPRIVAVRKKKRFAREYFNKKYEGKERKKYIPILLEVLCQIQVCEELCCPVSEDVICKWIDNGNLVYIDQTARSIKFA